MHTQGRAQMNEIKRRTTCQEQWSTCNQGVFVRMFLKHLKQRMREKTRTDLAWRHFYHPLAFSLDKHYQVKVAAALRDVICVTHLFFPMKDIIDRSLHCCLTWRHFCQHFTPSCDRQPHQVTAALRDVISVTTLLLPVMDNITKSLLPYVTSFLSPPYSFLW